MVNETTPPIERAPPADDDSDEDTEAWHCDCTSGCGVTDSDECECVSTFGMSPHVRVVVLTIKVISTPIQEPAMKQVNSISMLYRRICPWWNVDPPAHAARHVQIG